MTPCSFPCLVLEVKHGHDAAMLSRLTSCFVRKYQVLFLHVCEVGLYGIKVISVPKVLLGLALSFSSYGGS